MPDNIIEVEMSLVNAAGRFRKDFGDISKLAKSINDIGLLHPIVIDSAYRLVCGERRLRAFQMLGKSKIPVRFVNLDSLIKGELAENECRENFRPSELVAIGEAIEDELRDAAEKRMKAGVSNPSENFPKGLAGRTSDLAATAAGFGNGKTYEQAKAVTNHAAPELVQAMDDGRVSVSAAAALLDLTKPEQAALANAGKKEVVTAAKKAKAKKRQAMPEAVKPAGTAHVLQIINAMDNLLRYLQREGMGATDMADLFCAEIDLTNPVLSDRFNAISPVMRELGRIASELEIGGAE